MEDEPTLEQAREAVLARENSRCRAIGLGMIVAGISFNMLELFNIRAWHWIWPAVLISVGTGGSIVAFAAVIEGKLGELQTGLDISGRYISFRAGANLIEDRDPKKLTLPDCVRAFSTTLFAIALGLAAAAFPAILCYSGGANNDDLREVLLIFGIFFVAMGPPTVFALTGRVGPQI